MSCSLVLFVIKWHDCFAWLWDMCLLIFFVILRGYAVSTLECDQGMDVVHEGNRGQTASFPWLGVLRVHLHEGAKFKIALTGVILIKNTFAIANANDISRIPRAIMKDDSRVMFILEKDTPWYCTVKDYMNHPEFEIMTLNTISLLELHSDGPFRARPICWPRRKFSTKNELYAIGYTDENKLLEKFIYKLQYIEKPVCDEFYQRSKLLEDMQAPIQYQCGYVVNATKNCLWDNGMAFVSNASGLWTLIGLGVVGPGCAAPSRFIEFSEYMSWISTAMTLDDVDDFADEAPMELPAKRRKNTAFGIGFRNKPHQRKFKNVPIHTVLDNDENILRGVLSSENETYDKVRGVHHSHETIIGPHDNTDHQEYTKAFYDNYLDAYVKLDKLTPTKYRITFQDKFEIPYNSCSKLKYLFYKENFELRSNKNIQNRAVYAISLFDLYFYNITCIILSLNSPKKKPAELWLDFEFSMASNIKEQPSELLKKVQYPSLKKEPKDPKNSKPYDKLTPNYIKDVSNRRLLNYNIRVEFNFGTLAELKLEVFGIKKSFPRRGKLEDQDIGNKTLLRNKDPESHKPKNENDIMNYFWSTEEMVENVENLVQNKLNIFHEDAPDSDDETSEKNQRFNGSIRRNKNIILVIVNIIISYLRIKL